MILLVTFFARLIILFPVDRGEAKEVFEAGRWVARWG